MLGQQIFKNNEILNRVEINGGNNCFFTLKDQKDNLPIALKSDYKIQQKINLGE